MIIFIILFKLRNGKYKNGSSYTATVDVTGIDHLNISEMHMDHKLERPRKTDILVV